MVEQNKRRIVIANGLTYDKRFLYEIFSKISSDLDIRKLALLGPVFWSVGALVTIIVFISTLKSDTSDFLQKLNALSVIVLLWLLMFLGSSFIDALLGTSEKIQIVKRIFLVFKPRVWKGLTYWYSFGSNAGDRDPLLVLSNCINHEIISSTFMGVPYYNNYFANSIYLQFTTPYKSKPTRVQSLLSRLRQLEKIMELNLFSRWKLPLLTTFILLLIGLSLPYLPRDLTPFPIVNNLINMLTQSRKLILLLMLSGLSLITITKYFRIHLNYYQNSSGFSEYSSFINPELKIKNGEIQLSNSLNGYGVFYLSLFLREFFGSDATFNPSLEFEFDEENGKIISQKLLLQCLPFPSHFEESSIKIHVYGLDIIPENGRKKILFGEKIGLRFPIKKFVSIPTSYGEPNFPFYNK